MKMSPCMLIAHKDHNNTIHVYSVTVMTHVIALQAGLSSQSIFEPILSVFPSIRSGVLFEKLHSWTDTFGITLKTMVLFSGSGLSKYKIIALYSGNP